MVNSIGPASLHNQMAMLGGCVGLFRNASSNGTTAYARQLSQQGYRRVRTRKTRMGGIPLSMWCREKGIVGDIEDGERGAEGFLSLFHAAKRRGYVTWFGEEFCTRDSPWVVQGNLFSTDPIDYQFDRLYCRLPPPEGSCVVGQFRHGLPLQSIEKLWDAYPDAPKLAFASSIPAHYFTPHWDELAVDAEGMDAALEGFLGRMLARADMDNTLVVLRGDHGLQLEGQVADYSTQVEQKRPVTYVVSPRDWVQPVRRLGRKFGNAVEEDALSVNADRLVTGFDLHRTLLRVIEGGGAAPMDGPGALPTAAPWAVDVLGGAVPAERTCADANIPMDFCACVNEYAHVDGLRGDAGTPHAPRGGVCNFLTALGLPHCVAPEL